MLTSMGFPTDACKAALIETKDDVDAAVNWLISHTDELATLVPSILNRKEAAVKPAAFLDGEGRYELVGFISHMGRSTLSGHYVCHIRKNGRWILFNDEKVAVSESPPRELGYLYLYRRSDVRGVLE